MRQSASQRQLGPVGCWFNWLVFEVAPRRVLARACYIWMMRGGIVWLMCAIVAACAAPQDAVPPAAVQRHADVALPPVPFEDAGACPFDGCLYRQWTATADVDVRAERADAAPVIFSIAAGERVNAVTGVVVTTRPGRVRFRKQVDLPSDGGAVHVEPGQDLQLLTHHRDGTLTAAVQGVVRTGVDGSTFMNDDCEQQPRRCVGEVVARPEYVWWVQLRDPHGRTGWTNEPQKFDGTSVAAGGGENR
jgi:hypothetical protein